MNPDSPLHIGHPRVPVKAQRSGFRGVGAWPEAGSDPRCRSPPRPFDFSRLTKISNGGQYNGKNKPAEFLPVVYA